MTASDELRRQLDNLVRLGYPPVPAAVVARLERCVGELHSSVERRVPFVLVVPGMAIERVELAGRPGFTTMEADDLERFAPIPGIEAAAGVPYLLADVDTRGETLNVTPDEALRLIEREGRSPLTIGEGVALVTHHPDILRTHNSFSLLGSRCGDRRVPAIWVSERRPRLGWCWAGNPHTWLGSASCAERIGVPAGAAAPV